MSIFYKQSQPSLYESLRQQVISLLLPSESDLILRDGHGFTTFRGGNAELLACTDDEIVLSGPAETGKTIPALIKLHRLAIDYPGAQLAMVRKVYQDMIGSVMQSYLRKILPHNSPVVSYGGSRPEQFIYPNGSIIWVGGMDHPGRVLSSERDGIYVNQAEELALSDWQHLGTRVTGRSGVIPNPQLFADANPGPPSHWILQRAAKGDLRLLSSRHIDNPSLWDSEKQQWTKQGEQSMRKLNRLSGVERDRLLLGLWAAPEGAIFDIFDQEANIIDDMPIPGIWPRMVGVDPLGAHTSAIFVAFDPASTVLHAYREYDHPYGLSTPDHVENLLALAGYDVGGHSTRPDAEPIMVWAGGGPGEKQSRLDWTAAGIPLLDPEIFEVWAGIDRIYQLLKTKKLVIHRSCMGLIGDISTYSRMVVNGIVTDTILNKDQFHLLDALRYIVCYLTKPVSQQQISESDYKITTMY